MQVNMAMAALKCKKFIPLKEKMYYPIMCVSGTFTALQLNYPALVKEVYVI